MAIPGKNSFIVYHDHKDFIDALSNEQVGFLFRTLFEYSILGETPEINDPFVKMAFIGFKAAMDRANEKYQAVIERNRQNGKRGGRPKNPVGYKKPSGLFGNPKNPDEPKKADSDSDSDSVSDSDRIF